MNKYYYFGELGFFNIEILGALEIYFNLYPDEQIEIYTFKDYGDIIKLLYDKNVIIHYVDTPLPNVPNNRSGHVSVLDKYFRFKMQSMNLMMISKSQKLYTYMKDEFASNRYAPQHVRPRIFYRSTPIRYTIDNLIKNNIVCICPRYRQHFSGKNLLDSEWEIILNKIKENKPQVNIVALGKKEELLSLDNVIYPNDIYEHIHYLNYCDFGVFPDSGMAEFAVNCACPIIKVIYKKKFYDSYSLKTKQQKPLLHGFNPFNITIEKYLTAKELQC